MRALSGILVVSIFAGMLCFAGCGGNSANNKLAALNSKNIQKLANLYVTYQMGNNWEGPEDEEAFKKFIREYSPKKLERIGIDPATIDEVFVNERDGEPFKVRYGVAGSMMGCDKPVVFESVGSGGKRMVGFLNMTQREVEPTEYDELWNGEADFSGESVRDQDQDQ